MFPWCTTREHLSIDVSITICIRADIDEAKVISALSHMSKFEFRTFLKKKNQIFGFTCCSTREDLSIDISITNVGLILTKPGGFSFLMVRTDGQTDLQTDRHGFGILIWKHVGTQKKFNWKLKISG